jgi:bifunctional lysine-specific demethylase and histidyl-hydroxylase NO66
MDCEDTLQPFLGSVPRRLFLNEYWDRAPLHVRFSPALAGAHDWAARIKLLFNQDFPEWGPVQLASAVDHHVRSSVSSGSPSADVLSSAFAQGCTLVLNDLDTVDTDARDCCCRIENATHFRVNANAYWTPPNSQGLKRHFDLENVFVLQLDGEKTWTVWEPEPELRWPARAKDTTACVGKLVCNLVLRPGDILYIPRGFPHEATAREQASLHITLAASHVSWSTLMHHLIDECADRKEELRQALPIGFLRNLDVLRKGLTAKLDMLSAAAQDHSVASGVLDSFAVQHLAGFAPSGPVADDDGSVEEDTLLKRRSGTEVSHVYVEGDRAHFVCPGVHIVAPAFACDTFLRLQSTDTIRLNEIVTNLSHVAKKHLVERFIREGVFQIQKAK